MIIYFIQANLGPIKIGVTGNLKARIASMNIDNHCDLTVLASVAGDQPTEQMIHRALFRHKSKGEWFKPHAPVFEMVLAAREDRLNDQLAVQFARNDHRERELTDYSKQFTAAIRDDVNRLLMQHSIRELAAITGVKAKHIRALSRTGNGPIDAAYGLLRSLSPSVRGNAA